MENQNELQERFFESVVEGSIEKVEKCIEEGVDINSLTSKENNALYVAATRKRRDLFEYLLTIRQDGKRINLDNQNSFGNTAIMEFVKEGHLEFYLQRLLDEGANPNIESNSGLTPLIQACADKRITEVEILAKLPNIEINKKVPKSGTTAFLMASAQSSMTLVEILLANGADYNAHDSHGKNALLNILSKSGQNLKRGEKIEHEKLCEFLIDIGIDLNYKAPGGMTAFWVTSLLNNNKLAQQMINKGVDVNVTHEFALEHKESALHIWCKTNKLDIVKSVIDAGGKLGVEDELGNFPESYGFLMSNLKQLMLDSNANVNAQLCFKDKNKIIKTPVFSNIVGKGTAELPLIKEMIARGVKVTYEEPEFKKNEPIYLAIAASSPEILTELINTNKIDINQQTKFIEKAESISPLSFVVSNYENSNFAAQKDQRKFFESIIKGKEINDKNGIVSPIVDNNALKDIQKSLETLKLVEEKLEEHKKIMFDTLINAGAKVNQENEEGNTAAFVTSKAEYLNWLMEAGADLFHINKDGQDLLYYSILNGKKETLPIIKYFYEKENHKTLSNLFYQLAFEDYTKSYLKQNNVENGIVNFLNNPDIFKILDPQVPKEEKPTVYIKEVDYQDEDGNTPMIVAAANDTPFLISLFLKLGADINKQNNLGETPLMHATATENSILVDFLLEQGADINIQNANGETAFDISQKLNNEKLTKTIFRHLEGNVEENKTKKLKA